MNPAARLLAACCIAFVLAMASIAVYMESAPHICVQADIHSGQIRTVKNHWFRTTTSPPRDTPLSRFATPTTTQPNWQLAHGYGRGSHASGRYNAIFSFDSIGKHAETGNLTPEAATAAADHVLANWSLGRPGMADAEAFMYDLDVWAHNRAFEGNPLTPQDIQRLIAGHDPWAEDEPSTSSTSKP